MKNKGFFYKILIIIIIFLIILLGYFLIRKNIEKSINFYLLGKSNEVLYLNEKYYDLGYYAKLKDGTDISSYVTIDNKVNTHKIGEYTIKYSLDYKGIKKELIRKISIIKDPASDIDLKLIGDSVVYLLIGEEYQESGIIATDTEDGDIRSSVMINNNIKKDEVGEYTISYIASNSRNVKKIIERKVIIYDYDYNLIVGYNNGGLNLSFSTNSDLYANLVINSQIMKENNINHKLEDDTEYNVEIIDIYGNSKKFFYDYKKPVLSCVATITDTKISIGTEASDNSGIKEYNYYFGEENFTSKESSYEKEIITDKKIYVSVLDNYNNSLKKECTIINNVSYFSSGLKQNSYKDWGYYLYVPNNVRKNEKRPLIIFLHGTGECGSDLSRLDRYGFIKSIKAGNTYDSFVLVPQLKSNRKWRDNQSGLIEFFNTIKKEYNIDDKKVSIMGYSLGANDIASLMINYSSYFASTVLIAPSNRGADYAKYFKETPTKVFNGKYDSGSVPTTNEFVNELKKIGGNVSYVTYPDQSHANKIVDKVLSDGVANWMTSQSK